ncbi:hypothetical protein [Acidovorax sp. M2(2025)]|uniref:hypothetical protein n=1 Tax=Acidovorax sp. M2(2025) TaxID=3411355 RepID=UPI003BF47601
MRYRDAVKPLFTATLLLACAAASAQTPPQDARARYEQERQRCQTNNTQDSLATCLREATNAYDAARKGQLSDPGPIAIANATQRCEAFQNTADRAECVRRIESDPASGSVSGGGVLRESVTTTVIPQ